MTKLDYQPSKIAEYSITKRIRLPKILSLLNAEKNDRILEVGSGTGYFIANCSRNTDFSVGLELTHENNKLASRVYSNTKFITGSGAKLPFKNDTFTKIICTEVIEHIQDDKSAIKDMQRVLKTGGLLVLTTPNLNPTISFYKLFQKMAGVSYSEEIGHVRKGYYENELKDLFTENNFKILKIETIYFFFPMVYKLSSYLARLISHRNVIKEEGWTSREVALSLEKNKIVHIYKLLFPLFYFIAKLDFLFSPFCKGHNWVIQAKK